MSNDELYHHGIDGQRWGVRHGPPYPLERSEHNKVVERSEKASKKRNLSYSKSGKYAKQMTDKDLNDTIDRLQREETYRQLVSKKKNEKAMAKKAKAEKREAKKIYEDRQEQQKIQNDQRQQELDQKKRADSITRKVIERLLTTSAGVAGSKITDYIVNSTKVNDLLEKNLGPRVDKKDDKKDDKSVADEAVKKAKEKVESLEKEKSRAQTEQSKAPEYPDLTNMKFAGGDWVDSPEDLDSRLIRLASY